MIMKKVPGEFILVVFFCFCGLGFADYSNPPDWSDSKDFTHQSWDFNYPAELEPDGPELPVPPDGEPNWANPFGEPCLINVQFHDYPTTIPGIVGWRWYYPAEGFETERRGYWGGMGNVTLTFKIPNKGRGPLWQKQIWIQMTYLARKDGGKTYDIAVAKDPNFSDADELQPAYLQLDDINEPQGNVSKWYRLTAAYVLANQPQTEYVRLTAYHLPISSNPPVGGAAMIDQVDIDTRAVNPNFVDVVDFKDYAALIKEYKGNSGQYDLWPDGQINLKDLSVFLESWLKQGFTQ
jgi:hypothetical protein